jgi:hypothetical protein
MLNSVGPKLAQCHNARGLVACYAQPEGRERSVRERDLLMLHSLVTARRKLLMLHSSKQ